jgi:hypothetical protein
MVLELNEKEFAVLTRIVENYLPEMRGLIASGGPFEWRTEMKQEEETVKGIIAKLQSQKVELKKAA